MNYSVIRTILGKLAILLAGLMVLPLIVSLLYQEGIRNILSFLIFEQVNDNITNAIRTG